MRRPVAIALVALALAAGAAALLGGGEEPREAPPAASEPDARRDRTAPARAERGERDRGEGRRGGRDGRRERRDAGAAETGPALDGRVPGSRGGLVVGLGDQNRDFMGDPRFRRLGVRHVRLNVAWDAPLRAPRELGAWLDAARAAGVEPLLAFNHRSGERCPSQPCSAPRPAQFERAFAALRRRWPWVRQFSTWNEPNHASQPLARRPELLAEYLRVLRRRCRGCTILAADVVADRSAPRYVRALEAALGSRPRLWGVHNYPDVNRFTDAGTRAFLRLVRGEVWITETGGIVEFTTADGRAVFAPDERRAARATRHMFRVARSDPRIRRLYVYQWRKTGPGDRFDAGLVRPDHRSRPALGVLRREIAR